MRIQSFLLPLQLIIYYYYKNEIPPKIVIVKRKINKDLQTLKQSFIFTHIKSLIMKRDRNLDIKNKKNY